MPGKIKVKVLAGRNLPVMDRAGDTTDAFVEIKFGGVTHKTDVCRKSLNPHWSSTEWYRFEVNISWSEHTLNLHWTVSLFLGFCTQWVKKGTLLLLSVFIYRKGL